MPEADLLSLFAVPLEKAGLPYMVTGATAAILYLLGTERWDLHDN